MTKIFASELIGDKIVNVGYIPAGSFCDKETGREVVYDSGYFVSALRVTGGVGQKIKFSSKQQLIDCLDFALKSLTAASD